MIGSEVEVNSEEADKTGRATALEHGKYVHEHGLWAAMEEYPNVKESRLRTAEYNYAKNHTGSEVRKTEKAKILEHGKYVYENGLWAAVEKYPNVKKEKLRSAGSNHTTRQFL